MLGSQVRTSQKFGAVPISGRGERSTKSAVRYPVVARFEEGDVPVEQFRDRRVGGGRKAEGELN